ncbi:hypothetical protein LENED_007744 [Lentinula edodes]|uniref:Uncharacterized protein n=1 Tax=Lentinula edodes TaxID=5353 RepID=A0A1Q3EFC5_LENED|nr:hypothetical protein LENED_007744 [Lentinula edodes]
MSTSRTTTTTNTTAGPLRSRPAVPPPPANPVGQENEDLGDDEDEILRRAHERVRRIREQKAAAAAKKKADEEAAKKVAEDARKKKVAAARELEERRRLMAEAATTRSQRGTSPSEMSVSPQRPVVELRRVVKGKGKAKAQPVGGDPDDGDDGDDDDDDEEDRAPCEWCKAKKLPCQMQAGKRSSIIYLEAREGGPRRAYLPSWRAKWLRARSTSGRYGRRDSKTPSVPSQLLRRQEDDHARLMPWRRGWSGYGGDRAEDRRGGTAERRRPLKREDR